MMRPIAWRPGFTSSGGPKTRKGGVADSLDEAKTAFRAAVGGAPRRCAPAESRRSPASAFLGKSGRDYAQPEPICS
jgi:hypothetical protein